MTKWLMSLMVLVFLAPLSMLAETVTCESEDGRLKECTMDTRGTVQMVKQLSQTKCVQGVNWGINRNSIWVNDGCRAVFQSSGTGYSQSEYLPVKVTCESEKNRSRECAMNTRGGVRIVRQLSQTKCVEGVNWKVNRNAVWVDDGCRAEFESIGGYSGSGSGSGGGYRPSGSLPARVTCESEERRMKECAMNTRGSVRMVKQLSSARCVEGVNWGLNRNSIWVKDGCRAVFELVGGSGSSSSGGPPSSAVRACNAVQDRNGEVVNYMPLKSDAWEIILRYRDGEYVCNVERDGRVTYFEKLRR